MAEFGAHLNQNASSERPTIFEVIAQESMTSVLRPAVNYALKIIASSRPDRLGWLWRYGEELYTALDLMVQNYFLRKYGGSFSEHFYGLKRAPCEASHPWTLPVRTTSITARTILSDKQRYLSLLALVVVPYLRLKMDQYFNRLKEENLHANTAYSPRRQALVLHIKKILLSVYPFLHCVWESTFLGYQMLYMFSRCDSHSPLVHWIGLKLQRLSKEDILAQVVHKDIFFPFVGKKWKDLIISLPLAIPNILAKMLANGLPLLVFFLKFMEWWYSSENSQTVTMVTQLPIPPPPPKPKPAEYGLSLPSHPAQCPLCAKVRTNPTALSTCGYVFCYPCIYRYLGQHGCCPVTHLPSTQQQLVRIYVSDDM
ncbi:predicted protein [Nematostella vectensis]|uniref:Peroxisome assembly protein 12 n=1 Tax=Nematostella vectensis TaxID=45351 RepID=A7RXH5_NEMVE|nr:predicted protein [Nematostella vectensis]|eukprot:XP_001635840.1 predicted protein [Nematostella vectensis]